jgi:hypothetical protein
LPLESGTGRGVTTGLHKTLCSVWLAATSIMHCEPKRAQVVLELSNNVPHWGAWPRYVPVTLSAMMDLSCTRCGGARLDNYGVANVEILNFLENIVRDLMIFVAVLFAILVVLLIVVSRMSPENPLRQLLGELCRHVAITMAAGIVAIPVEMVPGVDVAYDTLVPLALVFYWARFVVRFVTAMHNRTPPPSPAREIIKK